MTEATATALTSGNIDPGTIYDNSAAARPGTNTQIPQKGGLGNSIDAESLIRERLRTSPPWLLASVRHFEKIDRRNKSLAHDNGQEIEKLTFDIQARNHSIASLEFSLAHGSGHSRREIFEPTAQQLNADGTPAGGQTVKTIESNDLALLKSEQAEDMARLKEIRKEVLNQNWMQHIRGFLGTPNLPDLIQDSDFPELLDLAPGEALAMYESEYIGLNGLKDELQAAWDAPRTRDEAMAAAMAWIDRTAAEGAPGVGGFFRGHSERDRKKVVATRPALGFVTRTLRYDPFVECFDGEKTMAWLFKDQLKTAVAKLIDAGADPSNAISAEAKPQVIQEIESRVYNQRRILEISVRQLENAGRRFVKRPTDTPVSILLQFLPGGVQPDPEFG